MTRINLFMRFSLALLPLLLAASTAWAAGSFSNSLTGFTGDSTVPATQTAVAGAGFNFFEFGTAVTKVRFGASGATFGDVLTTTDEGGNAERNYVRTNDSDYANHSFVAEITIATPNIDIQDAYFGFGSGNVSVDYFRTPDYLTPAASLLYWGENEVATPNIDITRVNNGGATDLYLDPAPGLADGIHRVRLTYDWFQKTAVFSFDLNYAGGAFAADLTALTMSSLPLYDATGWPTEPARIFFGGDQGVVFKEFQVTVTSTAVFMADFNSSGTVTSADWAILRANQHTDLSGKTFEQAFFLGDLNGDKANNHADFAAFKVFYEAANGAGSFATMLSGVPEPTTLVLILSAGLMALSVRRRKAERV